MPPPATHPAVVVVVAPVAVVEVCAVEVAPVVNVVEVCAVEVVPVVTAVEVVAPVVAGGPAVNAQIKLLLGPATHEAPDGIIEKN